MEWVRSSLLAWLVCLGSWLSANDVLAEPPPEATQAANDANQANEAPPSKPDLAHPLEPPEDKEQGAWMTERELVLAVIVVSLGAVTILTQHISLMRIRAVDPNEYTKATVLTLVIVGTLITVAAGFSAQDIAPAMGLFGTIAGYVIGARTNHTDDNEERRSESAPQAPAPPDPIPAQSEQVPK